MSFLGKNYSFVKQENFDGFLRSAGVAEEKIDATSKFTPDQKLVKDGDTYTFITATPDGPSERKFKSGEEFDDVIGSEKVPIKSTFVVDGNTVTQTVVTASGTATFKREYDGDDLVVTITSDKWDGVAKRYYKAT